MKDYSLLNEYISLSCTFKSIKVRCFELLCNIDDIIIVNFSLCHVYFIDTVSCDVVR